MTINRRAVLALTVAVAAAVAAPWPVRAAGDPVAELAALIAERLTVMPDVARHKYNTGAAVEDLPREAQVLAAVTAQATQAGLDRDFAAAFFQAQIDAAKIIQQAGVAAWTAEKREKFANVPDLATVIRPRLDGLTPRLIAALAAARPALAGPDAAAQLEKLAAAYAAAHNKADAAAFRRALAPLAK